VATPARPSPLERGDGYTNAALQRAFAKYGKENFQFVVYAYAPYEHPAITDLETHICLTFLSKCHTILIVQLRQCMVTSTQRKLVPKLVSQ
jgi:hypothetical protein